MAPTPGQLTKEPMFIPVAVGLLNSSGKDIPLTSVYQDGMLNNIAINGQSLSTAMLQVKNVSLVIFGCLKRFGGQWMLLVFLIDELYL